MADEQALGKPMDVSDGVGVPRMTVRCLQGWKGSVSLAPTATLGDFLAALHEQADLREGDVLSLIIRGKRCDPNAPGGREASLSSLGVADGAAVMLVVRSAEQRAAIAAQEERACKLREVERAAELLSARVGLASSDGDYDLSITNQDGTELELDPTDRKALALGALLHAKGSALVARCAPQVLHALNPAGGSSNGGDGGGGDSSDASPAAAPPQLVLSRCLEDATHVLEAAEGAFGVVSPKYHSLGDNYALILLDCVWSALLTHLLADSRDRGGSAAAPASPASPASPALDSSPGGSANRLASMQTRRTAGARLERAKQLLQVLHGEGLVRLAGREDSGQQRAVYVKLMLLQGSLAMVEGEHQDALSLLRKADALRRELTLTEHDDDKISALVALGVSTHAARASLLACGKDVQRAAAHALEKAAAAVARRERAERDRAVAKYGKSSSGRLVDAEKLGTLCSLGYDVRVAAEALRRSDNDTEAAVSLLCDPSSHESIQMALLASAGDHVPTTAAESSADEGKVASLCEMGFEATAARAALRTAHNDLARAIDALSRAGDGGGEGGEGGEGAAATPSLPAPPPPPPPPPEMSEEEHRTIAQSELRAALSSSERAYEEAASLQVEAVVIEYLLRQIGEQQRGGTA